MRQYYLCNPANQDITGPHPLADLISLAKDGAITAEWFVAEPGSESFVTLSESFSLNEILFHGGAVPVEPPSVAGAKLKNGPKKPSRREDQFITDNKTDHHAEFARVVEKSVKLRRDPLPNPSSSPPPIETTGALTPDNVILGARADMQKVLKKHDDLHFRPPTYWESPAGERMRNFLQVEAMLLTSGAACFGIFALFGLLTNFFIIALPVGLILLTISFAYVFLIMQS